jgi:hypothetical protein
MSKALKGRQTLNGVFKQASSDTSQSLKYSKDFSLNLGEAFPAALTAALLLYLLGQKQRELDDPKAPLRLLAESASVYALTTYTSYVIPVLGMLGIAYTAGQQETIIDKVKHSGIAALGTLGSLAGARAGLLYNMAQTQLDVAQTLNVLPKARNYLKSEASALIKRWIPDPPADITTPKEIASYKAQQHQNILKNLSELESKLTEHEKLLNIYHTNAANEAFSNRINLRRQLSIVFHDMWEHLKPAQEALSMGLELPAFKDSAGLTSALKLSRHLETINAGYVKAARWANPILFGALGSLVFQAFTPLWNKVCDYLFNNHFGHTRLELPSHTLLNHHGDAEGLEHSNLLWQQHQRFNAFAQDPFSETTHQETLLTQAGEGLLDRAIHGH